MAIEETGHVRVDVAMGKRSADVASVSSGSGDELLHKYDLSRRDKTSRRNQRLRIDANQVDAAGEIVRSPLQFIHPLGAYAINEIGDHIAEHVVDFEFDAAFFGNPVAYAR